MKNFDELKEYFTQYLENHHCRKTSERYAILEKIFDEDRLFSADALYRSLQGDFRVSLATVYNTLNILIDCNLVIKHQFDDKNVMYERRTQEIVPHYLVCSVCGKIKKFTDKNIRTSIDKKTFAKFEPSHYSLYVYGKCGKCKFNTYKIK